MPDALHGDHAMSFQLMATNQRRAERQGFFPAAVPARGSLINSLLPTLGASIPERAIGPLYPQRNRPAGARIGDVVYPNG